MIPVRVKICGIKDPAGFEAAAECGADWIGFVFFDRSPRFVTPAQAASLSARRPGGPLRVGLFVDPTEAAVAETLAALSLDILQLYASAERVAALRARFGRPVWRSIGVASVTDLPASLQGSDGLVVEAKAPAGASRPGGNATPLDLATLAGWTSPGPWLLAGGLTPATVAPAIARSGARAVDVSSGVETAPGHKDPALIRAFIAAARGA